MPSAADILHVATAELGVKESPPNSNQVKYNTAYYNRSVSGPAYPWCCAFVWWVFREAGAAELFYGGQKTASCTTLYNHYRKQGLTVEQARPGDLVFFNFDGQAGVMNHVGICESCEDGYVITIDGNTGATNEANGGAVMRRKRALKYVGGVARPKYEEEENLTEKEIRAIVRDELAAIEAERAAQPVPAWGMAEWEAATKAGLVDGTRPMSTATRLELAMVAGRVK